MKSSTIPYLIGAIVLLAVVWLAVDKLEAPQDDPADVDSVAAVEIADDDAVAGGETTGAESPGDVVPGNPAPGPGDDARADVMAAVAPGALRFQFIGNEAIMITDGEMTLFSDFPYQSGAFNYMRYDFDSVKPVGDDVLCLITHKHDDHFDRTLWEKTNWKVLGPYELTSVLDTARVIPMLPVSRYKGIEVEAISTPHGKVEHYSYLVTWHGVRMYFTGDAEDPQQLLEMQDLDVMFISTWLLKQVATFRAHIDTKMVVAYHHYPNEEIEFYQERILPEQGDVFDIEFRPGER